MAILQVGNAAAIPTDTTISWQAGDILWNNAPAAGQPTGWVCTVAGSPGTWYPFGRVNGPAALITTATSGTLSALYSSIFLNPATTGTYSLPNVTSFAPGTELFLKNIASGSVTLTPLAANGYQDAAAITLTQNQQVTLKSAGGAAATLTVWFKMA